MKATSFLGTFGENPFNFKHFGLTYVQAIVEGKAFPAQPLTPDFESGNYCRTYWHHLMSLASSGGDCPVSYQDFRHGFCILSLDFTASLLDGSQSLELARSGTVRLELKFEQPLDEPIHCLLMSESDGFIEISRNREILIES